MRVICHSTLSNLVKMQIKIISAYNNFFFKAITHYFQPLPHWRQPRTLREDLLLILDKQKEKRRHLLHNRETHMNIFGKILKYLVGFLFLMTQKARKIFKLNDLNKNKWYCIFGLFMKKNNFYMVDS